MHAWVMHAYVARRMRQCACKHEGQRGPRSHARRSLQDFGIGKNSLTEGGVGVFIMFGAGAAVALVCWARGIAMRTTTPYQVRALCAQARGGAGLGPCMGMGRAQPVSPYLICQQQSLA